MRKQEQRVLEYMERFGSISSLEAFNDLGITRLSAVVFDLKRDGYNIYGKMESRKNRFGETASFKRYSLEPLQ